MSRETQADVFIKTLTEMLEDERARRSIRLRRQFQVHAERFQQSFRTGFDGNLRPSMVMPQHRQAASEFTGHATNG